MSVHPDGTGTGWTNVEAVDVNQPHGKDYLFGQHIAKGVRKRMNQEHSAFADNTVGGIHKPGGCAVLGMEITDDCTAPVVADGTYRGHGLVWAYSDTSNWAVLFCTTGAAGASTTGDWTVAKLHPDLQWGSGDVTWGGAHQFDSSVDFSKAAFDASVDFSKAAFDATIDASHAFFDGTVIASGLEVTGPAVHDGTSDFLDEVDVSSFNISGLAGLVGTYTRLDTDGNDITRNHCYQVSTAGMIVMWTQTNRTAHLLVDDVTDLDVTVCRGEALAGINHNFCAIVPKDWYFALSCTGTIGTITWYPFGDGSCEDKD